MFCGKHLTDKCTLKVCDLELECAVVKVVLVCEHSMLKAYIRKCGIKTLSILPECQRCVVIFTLTALP
jgi:hypothetical protein